MTIVPMDRAHAANGAGGGTPVLEARGLTKHFPVRGQLARPPAAAGRGARRGARRAAVHAV